MRFLAPTAMIGACPERGRRRNEEDPTVSLNAAPPIATAPAAERHGRFLTKAHQARRLIQLDRRRDRGPMALLSIRAVRVEATTGAARVRTWGARWHPQWSRLRQA
jgi:hypothetical protein